MKRALNVRPAKTVTLLLCLTLLSVQGLTSATSRTLRGTVMNDGEPIRGAVVQVENCTTLEVRSYITQQDGQYHFAGLKYEVDYRVWAKRGDKRSQKKTLSQFNERDSITIDLILE